MDSREESAIGVCRSIIRSAAALRRELDKALSPFGLSGPQFGILYQLETRGSMPLGELGKHLWVSCGNVTGLVDKLVEAGYVERIRPGNDRRVALAELTDKGRDTMRILRPSHRECVLRLTSKLDASDFADLQILLDKIVPSKEDYTNRPASHPGG
jgi:DNA-binding MarR family transcriptional regulator